MPYADPSTPELPWSAASETSHDAAVAARAFSDAQSRAVLALFVEHPAGLTQKEIAERLGMLRSSVCARVRALEVAGLLKKTAARRDGCAVYVQA